MRIERALRRYFGTAMPRMAVRTQLAWYWRCFIFLGTVVLGAILASFVYDAGRRFAGGGSADLADTLARLEQENARLRAGALSAERQLRIEQAARDDLARQIGVLQGQVAQHKEELAFFQNLMSADVRAPGVSIYRFAVEPTGAPGEYHYRLLLQQTGQREKEFAGTVHLIAQVQQNGKVESVTLPSPEDSSSKAVGVRFKYYRRIEGVFQLPKGAELKTLEARLHEAGASQPKITQSATVHR